MKKLIWTLIISLCFALSARAQVFVINDAMFAGRMSSIKVKIVDSLTNEPISFASVYVVPAKDTTITNFIISDTAGVATLKDVPYGNYVFHIEMMGYKHYSKEKYFREERVDLGTVKMKLDENYLSAITVSDVGNPIVMKQDTIEFNAASFRVGANGMLRDLIKRMPGMEITDDGKVKFNGIKLNYRFAPRRPGDVTAIWADPTLANKELGWKAERSVEETLAAAWAWERHLAEK